MTLESTETLAKPPLCAATGSALFIPLKREYYEAFERGEKTEEFRPYGPRWNERTCAIGRSVVLSMGYGKARRLHGEVVSFTKDRHPFLLTGWLECYGNKIGVRAARIGIRILPNAKLSHEEGGKEQQ